MIDPDREDAPFFRTSGLRWVAVAVGFTVAACLAVAACVFVLYLFVEAAPRSLLSGRARGTVALAAFVATAAVPVALLVALGR